AASSGRLRLLPPGGTGSQPEDGRFSPGPGGGVRRRRRHRRHGEARPSGGGSSSACRTVTLSKNAGGARPTTRVEAILQVKNSMKMDGPRDWPASTPFCGNDTMNWRGNLMGDEREQPRAANPEPQLKPDSRLNRMVDLAERKIQLEVELLEL